jgi:hypothetical protein
MLKGVKTGDNEITFDLGKTEVSLIGKVNAAVQLFDSNNQRLSSFTFNYTVTEDISLSEELTSQERTLLEIVVQDGPGLVDYFTQAKPLIEQYTNYVEQLNQKANIVDLQQKADTSYVDYKIAGSVNGSPIPISLASNMTDKTRNYVYTGTEPGYIAGHWYGWNGLAWVDGGVYQSNISEQNKIIDGTLKGFERYKIGDLSSSYTLAGNLTAIQSIEIIGLDPTIPVKVWMICRNYSTWNYRIYLGKLVDGTWQLLADSGTAFVVTENPNGSTNVSFTNGSITVNMRINYNLISSGGRIIDGSAITDIPTYIVSPKNVKITSSPDNIDQNKLIESNVKYFERYKDGDISSDNYKLAKGLAAIQFLEIIGLDPATPVKLWVLSRNRDSGWGYRFIFAKFVNGVWTTLVDTQPGFTVVERSNGATDVRYTSSGGITVNMRVNYKLIPDTSFILDGSLITDTPLFIVSPKSIRLSSTTSSPDQNKLIESNIKNFERYKDGDISLDNYKLAKGLAAIQFLEIIGLDPATPVKLWILSRNRTDWKYRFILGKMVNGVWTTLIDSGPNFTVTENVNGATSVTYTFGGITINMRINYKLIPDTISVTDGSVMTDDPLFIVSPKCVKLTTIESGGNPNAEAYDQSLNTTNSVQFASVTTQSVNTDTLHVAGTIPTGTLANPPAGLLSGDMWADITDSTTHPIVRVKA